MKQEEIRTEFPFFRQYPDWIFLENAGGSQVPSTVIDSISTYYSKYYVQLTANYEQSNQATSIVKQAHDFARTMMNGNGVGEIVFGSSTTQLIHTLAHAFDKLVIDSNDEIILTNLAHEANYGAWTKLRGKIVEWKIHDGIDLEKLTDLLSEQTRIVAIPHVSNLVGEILDIETIMKIIRRQCPKARVIVDGVGYAPHRAIDVRQWDVDFYVFSFYKVYGPHISVLYGSNEVWQELIDVDAGPNHFFISQSDISYQYELGCVNHEACAGLLGVKNYFERITHAKEDQSVRTTIEQAFDLFTQLERPLVERLIEYLRSKSHIQILGSLQSIENRLPTISFISSRFSSQQIVEHLHQHKIACRNGHMYAYRLVTDLNIDINDGVVRLSGVHYNTVEEIERCIQILDKLFT